MRPPKTITHVALDKALGQQPGRFRSAIAAGAVGTATATLLYKLLRRTSSDDES
jgi:hypothetical protein